MTNPLWDYSLAHYSLDGVAPACLALQDDFSLDVNALLYGAWLATLDRHLCSSHLAELEAIIAPWRNSVITPLRALRRQWRNHPEVADLRDELKALELRAEHKQQEMMLAYYWTAVELPRAPIPLRENLVLVAQFFNPERGGWEGEIRHLASLLEH